MKIRNIALIALVSLLSSIAAIGIYKYFEKEEPQIVAVPEAQAIRYVNLGSSNRALTNSKQMVDFTAPAKLTTPAVVHVKTTVNATASNSSNPNNDLFGDELFRWFYGDRGGNPRESMASGSGVIISDDGYIVTNNHVVENGSEIEVVLHNKKSYKAKIVGVDKDTDIALIKIDGNQFQHVKFADSDSVEVGEWVLAVGNPFNLASTVTAGIVSAKGRNINILQNNNQNGGNTAIESFIQTDAAVNPGNSGGALVNSDGQLIGINTAIATPTGTFAGYSFAVPSNLVKKVVDDLKEYGVAQRGFLGVNIRSMDHELAKELNLSSVQGVYLDRIIEKSAAQDAGLREKDVITKINGIRVNSAPELQEQVGKYRPNDRLMVEYMRSGKPYTTTVVLKNKYNNVAMIDDTKVLFEELGAEFENVSIRDQAKLNISGGIRIINLKNGKLKNYTDIREGFIVLLVNDKPVNNIDELRRQLSSAKGNVMLEGIYPEKSNATYLYAFKY